uniref:Uncharacterized protein n=1 Tax=Vespula pensylvanica TaxID=30213 RepID=A0A834UGH2_VESPE|nr:hypothetical protein H0235_001117 [Vespula pensylvanica]
MDSITPRNNREIQQLRVGPPMKIRAQLVKRKSDLLIFFTPQSSCIAGGTRQLAKSPIEIDATVYHMLHLWLVHLSCGSRLCQFSLQF